MLSTLDPKAMFHTAESSRRAGEVLQERMFEGEMHLMRPQVVLNALAIEIYLKCLIVIEDRATFRSEHELVKLYKKLSHDVRHELDQQAIPLLIHDQRLMNGFWANTPGIKGPTPHLTVKSLLKMGNRAFEKFRYIYEGKLVDGEGLWASTLITILRLQILDLRPDFADA